MVSKASGNGDINDFIKENHKKSVYNSGLQRQQQQGAPQDRGFGTGTQNLDTTSKYKLDTRGGFMKGALGRKGVATAELAVDGIIDMATYHIPRLYITNTSLNPLKVIVPSLGDGQEVWIRANGGVSFPIQNTAGTGDETTGNIECMAAADYTMTGDDWICFHYDFTDLKWHQVTAGKQNIGGGSSGEVFTWTANHSAAGFTLTNTGQISFDASGTNDARITASIDGLDYVIDAADEHDFFVGAAVAFEISSTSVNLDDNTGTAAFSVSRTSGAANFHNNALINLGTVEIDDDVDIAATKLLGLGTNSLSTNSQGDIEYRVTSSGDDHDFFVGGVLQVSIETLGMQLHNVLDVNNQIMENSGALKFASTSAITGSDVGWSGLTGDIYGNVQSGDSYFLQVNGTTEVEIDADGIDVRNGWYEGTEITAPAGLSNHWRMYGEDNGAGKTRLMVQFGTGAAQQITIEP